METATTTRRYYLDWVRVMVILTVFVYHSTRFFNMGSWHVKNSATYWLVDLGERVLETWMMPLCFVVSGVSVFYALEKTSAGKFVQDKVLRLFVPLAAGVFTHAALQVYLERVSHGQFNGSFFEFYPHYFEGLYGFGGNFAWPGMHLWYLEMLFVFCLVLLPLFLLFKSGWGRRFLSGLGRVLAVPGIAILFIVPLTWLFANVDSSTFWGIEEFGGWSILAHLCFFFSGYLIGSSERLQQSIERLRWVWLAAAVALTISEVASAATRSSPNVWLEHTDLLAYLWILTFLGWARRRLNLSTPGLRQANEAVLPFYILHQTVLLCIGYVVVQWGIPDLLKWVVITGMSFPLILVLYEFLVKRNNILRFLFGMKPLPKPVVVPAPQAIPAG